MNNFPLSKVLLPALFISSTVFSMLTLPLALIKEPVVIELPIFNHELEPLEIQPILKGNQKEVAIPYVGLAIVVSVGSGIASVEIMRRWQAYRKSTALREHLPNVNQNLQANKTQQETSQLPEYRPNISAIDISQKNNPFGSQFVANDNTISEVSEQVIETTQVDLGQTTTNVKDITQPDTSGVPSLSSISQDNNGGHQVSSKVVSQFDTQDKELVSSTVIKSRQQYQTCRIKIPHLKKSLFAMEFQGEYYSFFRAEETKQKLQDAMLKIDPMPQQTIVTKTNKGYVIWKREPKILSKKINDQASEDNSIYKLAG
ncbi:hypothetical protein [Lyngbya aestuarii]|uniref:hypothetical protein n=1 Tax=Lyngbya aestuarii TaxID=118322 RepID=UPI00403DCAA9